MSAAPLLIATGLTRAYGRYQALQGVDIRLDGGEILAFLGLNGAGKSTAMEIIAGARAADAGRVTICGCSLAGDPAGARARLGYLPQSPPLYEDMLVNEYLRFSARVQGVAAKAVGAAVARARGLCDLDAVGDRLVRHLSAGFRQRVGIAQAIVHQPAVLILDEPTTGLDPTQIAAVHELVRRLAKDCAIVLSTHILAEAETLATRVAILHEGRVVHDAPLERATAGYILRCTRDADEQALAALEGIDAVACTGPKEWHLSGHASAGPRIAELVVHSGWGLVELVGERSQLAQLFARVTAGPVLTPA